MVRAQGSRAVSTAGGGKQRGGASATPALSTPARRMLALQRSAGNAAVARAVEEERHEHGPACGHEQQNAAPAATGVAAVQRAAAERSSVLAALNSPWRPLDSRIRERAEHGYGISFGHVRVHTGPVAQRSAVDLGSLAYTSGADIVVGPQGVNDELLFHELNHVRDQLAGPVAGADNGAGVRVSHPDDPFERRASANGRKMAGGGMPDLPGRPARGAVAAHAGHDHASAHGAPAGPIPVARMEAPGGGRTMHRQDRGHLFEILHRGRQLMGRYVGPGSGGREVFDTTENGRIEVRRDRILGVRPTVSGLHPPGQVRPVEENFEGRTRFYLSEADLSAANARLRRDPSLAGTMGVTTYEDRPDYAQYRHNREDLRRRGVPVMNSVDLRDPGVAHRFSGAGPNPNFHFQMPRWPRNLPGYSTQQLVRDTSRLPIEMGRDDATVSFTLPHPDMYGSAASHNRIYGMESRRAVPQGMRVAAEHSDDEADLGDYGYNHRQSTQDRGADVARHRKKYRLERDTGEDRRSDSPPAGRSRGRSRARSRARSEVRGRSRATSRIVLPADPGPSRVQYVEATPADERRSRSRRRSAARSRSEVRTRSRSRARRGRASVQVSGPVVDITGAYEYGSGDPFERGRSRGRSRGADERLRSRSRRARRSGSVAYAAVTDDEFVLSQPMEDSFSVPRRSRRSRYVVHDSDDDY